MKANVSISSGLFSAFISTIFFLFCFVPPAMSLKSEVYPIEIVPGIDHSKSILSVAFSPNARIAISASFDGKVKLWDTASGRGIRTLDGSDDVNSSIAFSPDGRTVLSVRVRFEIHG